MYNSEALLMMDLGVFLGFAFISLWMLGGIAFGALVFRHPFRMTRFFVAVVRLQFRLVGCEEPRLSGFMPPHMQYVWDNEEETSDSADPNAQAWRQQRPFMRAMGGFLVICCTGLLVFGILVASGLFD